MSVVPFCKNKRTGDISSALLFCTIFLWYGNELSSIFLLISSLFVAAAHEMRYISTTLCHFYFIPSISLLLRETMPTRFPRLRLPRHTISANRKKMPATMKPNIFTLSFFITPHHTLLLIPAHNPPPRSFTPTPCNPHSLPFPVPPLLITTPPTTLQLSLPTLPCPAPAPCNPAPLPCNYHSHHFTAPTPAPCNPAHYLAAITPTTSLLPPLLLATINPTLV